MFLKSKTYGLPFSDPLYLETKSVPLAKSPSCSAVLKLSTAKAARVKPSMLLFTTLTPVPTKPSTPLSVQIVFSCCLPAITLVAISSFV